MSITAFPSVAFLRCLDVAPVPCADAPSVAPSFYHAFFCDFEALFKQSLSLSIIHCFILVVLCVYSGFEGRVAQRRHAAWLVVATFDEEVLRVLEERIA